VGRMIGFVVGCDVDSEMGLAVRDSDTMDGDNEGNKVGSEVGIEVGSLVGLTVGLLLGWSVDSRVG